MSTSPHQQQHSQTINPKLRLPASCDPPSENHPPLRKTWLIFGATGHIGRSIVCAALGHGDNVAAVGRMMENSVEEMQGWHERCEGLVCDVRVRETVARAVEACVKRFGGMDVVVNCTGYGVIASCEDQDAHDLRSQLDTNFFGTVNIIHATLPHLRERSALRSDPSEIAGRYLIFSSTSGALGVPGLGPYCATKYAVEGLVESMLYEIDAFGIKATLVEPGHVRLDEVMQGENSKDPSTVNGGSSRAASQQAVKAGNKRSVTTTAATETNHPQPLHRKRYGHFWVKPPSAPYASASSPSRHAQRVVQWLADNQPTSAVKSAELVWQLGHCRFPPLRLLLGGFAVESVRDRLRSITEEIEDWKFLHFPSGPGGGDEEVDAGTGESGRGGKGKSKAASSGKGYAEDDDDEEEVDDDDGGEEMDRDGEEAVDENMEVDGDESTITVARRRQSEGVS